MENLLKKFPRKIKLTGTADKKVFIDNKPLDIKPSRAIWKHSSEFNWGYGGSGPAQLACAILLHLSDQKTAQILYMPFKWMEIANIKRGAFERKIDLHDFIERAYKLGLIIED